MICICKGSCIEVLLRLAAREYIKCLTPPSKPMQHSTRMQAPLLEILDLELASSVLDLVLVSTSDTRRSAAGNLLLSRGRGFSHSLELVPRGLEWRDGD